MKLLTKISILVGGESKSDKGLIPFSLEGASLSIENSPDGQLVSSDNRREIGVSISNNRIKRSKVSKAFFHGFCFITTNSPFLNFYCKFIIRKKITQYVELLSKKDSNSTYCVY